MKGFILSLPTKAGNESVSLEQSVSCLLVVKASLSPLAAGNVRQVQAGSLSGNLRL